MKAFTLGDMVRDTVSDTEGMLTHLIIDMDKSERYIFQPKGLNPKTMQPVERISIDKARVIGGTINEIDVPIHLLGTEAEDIATEFKGTVIGIIVHINGCIHVDIKPKGTLKDTGDTIAAHEFDIRRIKIDGKPYMTKFELKKSIKEAPSPGLYPKNKIPS